ncbi:MAG: PKD domain-containing protein [Euryarchaeota archaeon]|nr:PKD domain-containing protein [Euryarchaeota archaeon]MDE1835919.1 PKD domain-containing protein [Euryarchaeota archaeon]MDE1880206.1 PKD domain-containing protein [Euryarchaeota archaeon]MDE2044403.1 PKD domain-containing protein [Thermoplasmata archaeon]
MPPRIHGQRGVTPFVAVLVGAIAGTAAGAGLVAFLGHSSYCPFNTPWGMEIPLPGDWNESPNATDYLNGSVVFWASASGCTPPYSFSWSFGDGSSSALTNVVHVYSAAGYYPGSLITRDSTGHHATAFFCIDASQWPALTARTGSSPPACPA